MIEHYFNKICISKWCMNKKMMQPDFQGDQNTPEIILKEIIRTTMTILKILRLRFIEF